MSSFAVALFLMAVTGQIAGAEDKVEAIPAVAPPVFTVAQPQAGPLFTTPAGVVPTTVGGFAAPAPIGPGAEARRPIQQVAAQSEVLPKLAALQQKQAELNALQQ